MGGHQGPGEGDERCCEFLYIHIVYMVADIYTNMKGEKFVNLGTSQTYSFAILLRIVAASPTALCNSLKLSLEVYILAVLNAIWRWVATFCITGLVSTSFPLLWYIVICVYAIEQKYGGGIYITAANALSPPTAR